MPEKVPEETPQASPVPEIAADPALETTTCILCESGTMKRATIKPYNQTAGVSLLIVGLLCLFLWPLGLVGLVLAAFGIYFLLARKDVWLCEKCDAIVERR